MATRIPDETIRTFAQTIHRESRRYGFDQIDTVRLINALMDATAEQPPEPGGIGAPEAIAATFFPDEDFSVDAFPLRGKHLRIRRADAQADAPLLEAWMSDEYGRHFLLSCATAQELGVQAMLENTHNETGIVELEDGEPIGAVAFLDIDPVQRRAELRKLIGVPAARGKGFAEECTALWVHYGLRKRGLEKIYVSTLQTHLRNIKLNESVGFRVEGVLRSEVRIGDDRFDVLRMGLTK